MERAARQENGKESAEVPLGLIEAGEDSLFGDGKIIDQAGVGPLFLLLLDG